MIELILACALSLIIMEALIQIYLNSKQSALFNHAMADIQENARFATDIISRNIRMAGDVSCEYEINALDFQHGFYGFSSDPPESLKKKVKLGSDGFLIQRCLFSNNSYYIDNIGFFVSGTSRKNKEGKKVYALYKSPLSGNKEELVPNIIDMKLRYTKFSDGLIRNELPAESVHIWENVKGVEVALLLQSENPVLSKPEAFTFVDELLEESRYLRKVWYFYVKLRER